MSSSTENLTTNAMATAKPTGEVDVPAPTVTIESLLAQIAKQKETMRSWKENVKNQLMEAQSKNRALKDERDALRGQLQNAENESRLRLEAEFKDRFASRDEEIKRLTDLLATSRHQRQADADEHLKILENLKEQFQKEAQLTAAEANATFNKELIAMEESVKESQKEAESLRHELSVQVTKTAAVEARMREVTAAAAETAAAEGSAERANAQRLAKELELAQQELAQAKEEIGVQKRRLQAAQESHAAALATRIEEEVRQRDDQLNVLQVMLRQCQTDVGVYQQRAVALQGQLDEERDERESRLSSIRGELLAKMALIEDLTKSRDALKAQCVALEGTVLLLEEEKEIRERAFAEIFLSDDQKQMIKVLEDQLSDHQQRAAEAGAEKAVLELALREAKAANEAILAEAEGAKKALQEKEGDIDAKMMRLVAQERRTREQSEQLVAQAERLRAAMANASLSGGGSSRGELGKGAVYGKATQQSSSSTTASVPIIEPDEHGRLLRDGVPTSSEGGFFSSREGEGGSGGGTLTANIDSFITQLRAKHHWADVAGNVVATVNNNLRGAVRYQQLSTYQQYRRLLPIIVAICFVTTFFYYWLFSSTSAKAGQTLRAAEIQETVQLVKQQYNSLVGRYNQCCEAGGGRGAAVGGASTTRYACTFESLMPLEAAVSAKLTGALLPPL